MAGVCYLLMMKWAVLDSKYGQNPSENDGSKQNRDWDRGELSPGVRELLRLCGEMTPGQISALLNLARVLAGGQTGVPAGEEVGHE